MVAYATKLKDGTTFDPFRWQGDEMLWASIKLPYDEQWRRWQMPAGHEQSTAADHMSNWSRAALMLDQYDPREPELIDRTAHELGKLAAGFNVSVALFRTPSSKWAAKQPGRWVPRQRMVIHDILRTTESIKGMDITDENVIADAEASLIESHERASMIGKKPNMEQLNALRLPIFNIAVGTTRQWLDFVEIHDGKFVMTPGATPRSTGPHIEQLRSKYNYLFNSQGEK